MPDSLGTRHLRVRVRVVAILLLAAASCSSGSEAHPVPSTPRSRAQDLTVAVGEDPFLPSPHGGSRAVGLRSNGPNPGIYETLTRVTPTFGVGPGLAEGWERLSPTRWRFALRDDVTFHDGSPFEAGAVIDTLDAVARRENPPRGLEPGGVTAVDEHTVDVTLSSPNSRLPEQLADASIAIRARGTAGAARNGTAGTPPGTGPFRLGSYSPGRYLEVVAFDRYWDGPPQLDSITFLFGSPEEARRRFANGEVLALGPDVTSTAPAQGSGPHHRVTSPSARAVYLLLNVGGTGEWSTLRDSRVRRAVAHAVDRRALVGHVWDEDGQPNDTLIPPDILQAAAGGVAAPAHDLAAARRLLDDAGWEQTVDGARQRGGRPLEVALVLAPPAELGDVAAVLAEQLWKVGVRVMLPDVGDTPAERFGRVNQGTFDLFLDARSQTDANPCALCRFFSIRPGGQLTVSGTVGAGDAADDLFEAAYTARSTDSARRWAAELMAVVVEDEVVAVPLIALPDVWLLSPRVQGFEPAPTRGGQRWDHVWLTP